MIVYYTPSFLQTENAASRIKELLSGESAKGAIGIRLGTKKRELSTLHLYSNCQFILNAMYFAC
jgi:hypothetical protein